MLSQYRKESTVFQVSLGVLVPFLLVLPEMVLDWKDELCYATEYQKALIFDHFIHNLKVEITKGTSRFRLLLVTHPDAPIEVLGVFAQSERWEERYLVARHPRTSPEMLKLLRDAVSWRDIQLTLPT